MNIMIVDDEMIFREYLHTVIDWNSYGFTICCEARNGQEALEQAKLHQPDIALVDISMPLMDGLTFVEKLAEVSPKTAVTIITGHNEFDCVRNSLRLGVHDYILKPFEKEELLLSVLKLKKRYNDQKVEQEYDRSNKEHLIRHRVISDLLHSEMIDEDAQFTAQAQSCGIFAEQSFAVACIIIDDVDPNNDTAEDRALWRYAVDNILNELMLGIGTHFSHINVDGMIISITQVTQYQACNGYAAEQFDRLCSVVKRYLNFSVTVGVGTVHSGLEGVRKSYLEALAALDERFIYGGGGRISYNALKSNVNGVAYYSAFVYQDLLLWLRMNDWGKIKKTLDSVIEFIAGNKLATGYRYMLYMGILTLCFSYAAERGVDLTKVFGENPAVLTNRLRSLNTPAEAGVMLCDIYKKVLASLTVRSSKSRETAMQAKAYVEQNFTNADLTVETVAANVYFNPSHLRSVFKKEMGFTISDYIIKLRMNYAREMIEKGGIKLSAVATLSGFNDAGYFSKCFRRHFGVSPSEYGANR